MTKTCERGASWATDAASGEAPYPVVVGAVDVSGHAEVSDLHQQVGSNQAVPGGQVAMHKVLGGEVHHAGGDLAGDVEHLGEPQLAFRLAWLPIHKDHRIWPVGPVGVGVGGEGREQREFRSRRNAFLIPSSLECTTETNEISFLSLLVAYFYLPQIPLCEPDQGEI